MAFFLNSLAFVPFALLQASGAARAVATFMLAELPLDAMTLVFAISGKWTHGCCVRRPGQRYDRVHRIDDRVC